MNTFDELLYAIRYKRYIKDRRKYHCRLGKIAKLARQKRAKQQTQQAQLTHSTRKNLRDGLTFIALFGTMFGLLVALATIQ